VRAARNGTILNAGTKVSGRISRFHLPQKNIRGAILYTSKKPVGWEDREMINQRLNEELVRIFELKQKRVTG